MKPASGQKSASVWIFSSEMATASCRPGAAGELLQAPRDLVGAQLAHVAPVHPAQLLLVELRRVARHALDAEALDEFVGGDQRLVVRVAPPEQGEVVAHRLGQVAGVAQLLHRRRAVAL